MFDIRMAKDWSKLSREVIEVESVSESKGRPGNAWLAVVGEARMRFVWVEMVERKASQQLIPHL